MAETPKKISVTSENDLVSLNKSGSNQVPEQNNLQKNEPSLDKKREGASPLPPKLSSNSNMKDNEKREEVLEEPKQNSKSISQNLKNISKVLSQNQTPKKLALTTWILLGTGAVIIDFVQGWIGVTVIASVINLVADFFIGLCLFSFFWYKKILDRRLAISLILAFLIDFVSLGIMPAWSFDIAYAWFITDGKKVVGNIPGAGEKVEKIVEKIATKKP